MISNTLQLAASRFGLMAIVLAAVGAGCGQDSTPSSDPDGGNRADQVNGPDSRRDREDGSADAGSDSALDSLGDESSDSLLDEQPTDLGSDTSSDGVQDLGPRTELTTSVTTTQGELLGSDQGSLLVFSGIPFAAPPTGDLRWRPPAPAPSWTGPREALEPGPSCPQLDSWGVARTRCTECRDDLCLSNCQAEDCLYLNLYSPAEHLEDDLPVMVWIHGGSFIWGGASFYDPSQLAELGDVIVVTINYRLGPLGSFSHANLLDERGECETCGPANYGLLDQIAALNWVKSNVAQFGGDAEQVTVFGESAGGFSVCNLLASPLATGLFQGGIIQSGVCTSLMRPQTSDDGGCPGLDTIEEEWLWDTVSMDCLGERVSEAAGCQTAADVVGCMREMSAWDVLKALPQSKGFEPGVHWAPFVDGITLSEPPGDTVQAGTHTAVPVLAGATANEASLFFWPDEPKITTRAAFADYIALWGECSDELSAMYPTSSDADVVEAYFALLSDRSYVCPVRRDARNLASSEATFLYEFSYQTEFGSTSGLGAYHSSELPLIMGSYASPEQPTAHCTGGDDWHCCDPLGLCFTPDDRRFSDELIGYWSRFAATGHPGGGWPSYSGDADQIMLLSTESRAALHPRAALCDEWERIWNHFVLDDGYCTD